MGPWEDFAFYCGGDKNTGRFGGGGSGGSGEQGRGREASGMVAWPGWSSQRWEKWSVSEWFPECQQAGFTYQLSVNQSSMESRFY